MKRYFLLIFWLFLTCLIQKSAISGNLPKVLELKDQVYEPQIRTVLLYPNFGAPDNNLLPAVIPFGQWNLQLEFDDLSEQRDSYYFRLVHCNHDWTKSDLSDLDFMKDFNDFPINSYEYSTDTHIPYIRYWCSLPGVKYPGNYVLVVYRSGDRDDIILSKRFMVYGSRISFMQDENLVGSGRIAQLNQQINFTIDYEGLDIINPMQDVWVSIRQNQRWDNVANDVRPSFVREAEHELDYRFFDPEKMFKGGNEFRFFDIRSLNYPGRNIGSVDKTVKPYEVHLFKDKSRMDEVYAQYTDMDGNYIISNLDYQDPSTTNYAYVNFALTADQVPGDVYVIGAFNQWNLNDENRMTYNGAQKQYEARVLLKQGLYNYQYLLVSDKMPRYYFEGSHFETENQYEIFVYWRSFQPRADMLIGYVGLSQNPR